MAHTISNQPREMKIKVPYGHIAGKVWNESAPVAVLCLHGWQDNAGTFDLLAPLLPDHLCLVAVDFHGHGRSSHKPIGFSVGIMDYITTVDRVIKHYAWNKVIILGHSAGGGVGILYASIRPNLVHSVISLDIIKEIHHDVKVAPEKAAIALDAMTNVENKLLTNSRPSYLFEDLLQRATKSHQGSLAEDGVKVLLKRGSEQLPSGRYAYTYDLQIRSPSLMRMSFEQQLSYASRLSCRLLIIKAKDGPFYEAQEYYDTIMDIYRSHCSEFVYMTVPGTHHVHLSSPTTVAPHIAAFLSDENVCGIANNRTEAGDSVVTTVDARSTDSTDGGGESNDTMHNPKKNM